MSQPSNEPRALADTQVCVSAVLEYRDADGNLLKAVPISTTLTLPLDAAPFSGDDHGLDL